MADARKFYSSTSWGISYESHDCIYCELANIFYPDDVAVTDNYVVFMGHKHGSAGIYMKHYLKSPTMTDIFMHTYTYSFSLSQTMYSYASPMNNFSVLGQSDGEHPVWCTHMKDDQIAIACMSRFDDGNITYGSTIKVVDLNSIPMGTKDYFFPYSGGLNRRWFVKDIRYDDNNDNILMLYDADNPTDGHLNSMSLHINNYYSSPYVELHYTSIDIIQHSQDAYVHPISNNIACGTDPANQWLTSTYYSNTYAFVCTPISKPDYKRVDYLFVSFEYTRDHDSKQTSQLQSTYTVFPDTSNPLCE
ncbi:MAG: hypothetical protein IJ785_00900 [Bacteroidales bacterium]|nr:hypothetical protein [Bacteroidales bacterium]